MSTLSGQIGPYTIEGEIGRGGMGVVYRATDPRLGRTVAIKALPEFFHDDQERLARFEREARTLAALNHPNVAAIYGLEEHEGQNFLVLEFVEGETLADRIDRGALPIDETISICTQVASGLEAAHDAGVIHRDLKPANIRITPDGKAKVLDFGLARAEEQTSGSSSVSHAPTMESPQSPHSPTVPGAILGTAPYMSPEQARGRTVDKRTDIWSFGVVLYECLTGMSPFVGETATDSIGAILHKDVDLSRLPPQTPALVRHLLERCLERDKVNRLRDIGDARIELQAARTAGPALAAVESTGARPAWGASIAVAVLAAIVTATAMWLGIRPSTPPSPEPVLLQLLVEDALVHGPSGRTFAIAPDGQSIVYAAGSGGITQLYRRAFDSFEDIELRGTTGARSPFFSRDGDRVGFFSQGVIKWVSLTGGSPLTLCPAPGLHYGGTWLDDGRIVFASSVSMTPLMVGEEGGGSTAFEITPFPSSPGAYRWPHALPDGENMLFSYYGAIDGVEGPHVVVVSTDTGVARRLIRGTDAIYVEPGYLVFGQGDDTLAAPFDLETSRITGPALSLGLQRVQTNIFGGLDVGIGGTGTLVYLPFAEAVSSGRLLWVERDGAMEALDIESADYGAPRLSPDGSRLAYSSSSTLGSSSSLADQFSIWVYDIARDRTMPITFGEGATAYPIWSPDSERVLFMQFGGSSYLVNSARADGSGDKIRVAEGEYALNLTSIAPSGEIGAMYEVHPATNRDIWIWRANGEHEPLIKTPANERAAQISPDGKWLAYVSDRSGRDEIYVTSFPDARGRWLISSDGGAEAKWSPRGDELFYRNQDRMMRVAVDTSESFEASVPAELFRGVFQNDQFGNPNYDISLDGQRFLMVQSLASERDSLNVVLNFDSEMKRLFGSE